MLAYGLLKDPPNAAFQRELVLLSKILQNLSNEQEFGKKEGKHVVWQHFFERTKQFKTLKIIIK